MIEEMASRARSKNDGELPGLAVKRVIAPVSLVVPGNLVVADARRIGIHGLAFVVDSDLPGRTARLIGAGNLGHSSLRRTGNDAERYVNSQGRGT